MKIICWNVRGLENPRTCLAVKKILHMHKPQLIFLCETKLKSGQVKKVCNQLAIENIFVVDSEEKIGGLAMMWNTYMAVQIKLYSRHHINFQVQNAQGNVWKGT